MSNDPKRDTQWPRWEVLKKDNERRPHQAVGSVHAAGAEHALLMARTVFARRPSAVSMWVVPAVNVHSFTAFEIEQALGERPEPEPADGEAALTERLKLNAGGHYYVVRKSSHRRSMTFGELVGEIEGATLGEALNAALTEFGDQPVHALWLLEAGAVARTEPEDAQPWFAPALDKTYKQQAVYSSSAVMRRDASLGARRDTKREASR